MRNLWNLFCRTRGRYWDNRATNIFIARTKPYVAPYGSMIGYEQACDRADRWWRRAGVNR